MNAVYSVGPRLNPHCVGARRSSPAESLKNKQFQDFSQTASLSQFYKAPDTVWTPRVLKDGSDSVGILGALDRVFINIGLFSEEIVEETLPGKDCQTDEDLRTFVRNNAWGHHASCTCPIGPRENGGVLSSDFRVHGVQGLRVVDASVFPRIPGFFIVSAIYMIAEKAADVILTDAKR